MGSSKEFADIHDDYAFFVQHATEAAADRDAILPHLLELGDLSRKVLHIMDFGCGSGEFMDALLTAAKLPPDRLRITLVEPDAGYRTAAVSRLAPYSAAPIEAYADCPVDRVDSVDLCIANHSLYYVVDLAATADALLQSLAPGGRFIAAIAHRENALIQIWQAAFAALDMAIPHHVAEDVEACLRANDCAYRVTETPYVLDFLDSGANRQKILRFLLADYLPRLDGRSLERLFDAYVSGDRIRMQTSHLQLFVRRD